MSLQQNTFHTGCTLAKQKPPIRVYCMGGCAYYCCDRSVKTKAKMYATELIANYLLRFSIIFFFMLIYIDAQRTNCN